MPRNPIRNSFESGKHKSYEIKNQIFFFVYNFENKF